MKLLIVFFINTLLLSVSWLSDFNEAAIEAVKSHKLILINFSGSDWCGPCIRERKELFETATFENYASTHLVLVSADFPRQKKNQLSKEQTKRNEALADKYNPNGKFPYTLLVDEHGTVLKEWDGFPNESPEKFIEQIASFNHAGT